MKNAVLWFRDNWAWLGPIVLYFLANIANAMMKYSPSASSALRKFIDDISFTTDRSHPPLKMKIPPIAEKQKKPKAKAKK